MRAWKRIQPTAVHKVGYRTIVTKTFLTPAGATHTFDTLLPEGQEFTQVIALTSQKKVIIARQFRCGPEKIFDELPGGFVDPGETVELATRRELSEETGYAAGTLRHLGSYHKDTYMNATWHAFLATDCVVVGKQKLEIEENIELRLISIDDLIYNARHDRMTDALAVFLAYDILLSLKEGQ
jgi:ADP-ribose pyrophosphatase